MKKFWRTVSVEPAAAGFRVALDGRGLLTPLRAAQVVPNVHLAEALAAEWRDQGDEVDLAGFALRDLADHAIDVVRPDRAAAVARLLAYAETDTLCYRAEPDEPIARRQRELWEPLLKRLETQTAVRFERISGVIHRPQPTATLAVLGALLDRQDDFTLSALLTMTSLAASLVIGLAALELDAETMWRAANLEEDWQAEQWGEDAQAQEHRDRRMRAFAAAARFARLAAD